MTGLDHEHAIAGRKGVDERGFPCAGPRGGIDHHLALRGLEHPLHPGEHLLAERGRTPARDGRWSGNRSRAARDRGRSSVRDLEEMAAGASGHWVILTTAPMNALDAGQFCQRKSFFLGGPLAQGGRRRGDVRRSEPRALLDRRLDLPGRADRRRCAAQRRSRARSDGDCGRARRAILPRGAGSSQCGQAVGAALVIDHTKYLNKILEIGKSHAVVQPGVVLDHLNAALRKHGLWFPVDVSTSAQATLGGMAGNNSCGSRSIEYGNMVHNVLAIDAVTATGARWRFADMGTASGPADYLQFVQKLKALYEREKAEIETRFPKSCESRRLQPRSPRPPHANAAHLLVGSEGTLAYPSGSTSSSRRCPRSAARRMPLPEVLHRDGAHAAHRQARAHGGRARRPHDDRPRAREPRSRRRSTLSSRATRTRSCSSSSPTSASAG